MAVNQIPHQTAIQKVNECSANENIKRKNTKKQQQEESQFKVPKDLSKVLVMRAQQKILYSTSYTEEKNIKKKFFFSEQTRERGHKSFG